MEDQLRGLCRFEELGTPLSHRDSCAPTRLEIEQCLREVKPRKAAGLDSVPGDVLKLAAKPFARLLEPLFFKSIAYVRQPVQWRGGMLVSAWKGSGPVDQVGSYRSLFVGSSVGKTFHRLIRNKVAPFAEKHLAPCHFGARAGSPVTHASHLVLAHEQWAQSCGHSSSTLFLDTRSAYYRVVREATTGMREMADMDRCVAKVLEHFSMPPASWETLLSLVRAGGAMHAAGASEHLRAVAEDLHADAFFVTQFAARQQVSRTRAGSRPGESMADVIFGLLYHQVLQQIHSEVCQQALAEPLEYDGIPSLWPTPPSEHIWFTDSTWADDTAFVTKAPNPADLMQRTKRLAEEVIDACHRHAMDPNLKKGKTEVMISLRGRGRKLTALHWFGKQGATLVLSTRLAGDVSINVVASYVHLGFQIDRGVTFRPEALRRLSQASAACREIRDLVLQNVQIPRPTRAQLFTALVDSTCFNLELWQQDVGSAWDKLVAGHSRMQRSILSKEMSHEEVVRLTPTDVTYLLGTPSLMSMLRAKRLRYLATLVRAAPPALWAVLKLEARWLRKLEEDLQWLCAHSPGPWPPVSSETWPLWWHAIKEATGRFKRQIGTAARNATLAGLCSDFLEEADRAVQKEDIAQGRACARRQATKGHFCPACQLPFASLSNLACHFRHVHGRRADHLYYAGGTLCCGCGANYYTIGRMLMHLKTVPRCWEAVRRAGLVTDTPHAGAGSRARKREAFANPAIVPACPPSGCRLVYDDCDAEVLLPREKAVMYAASKLGGEIEDWVAAEAADCDAETRRRQLWAVVHRCLKQFPFFSGEFQTVFEYVLADLRELQSQVLHWPEACIALVVACLDEWRSDFNASSLLDDEACAAAEANRAGTWVYEKLIRPTRRFSFQDTPTVVLVGDPLPDAERTHLFAICGLKQIRVLEYGWNLREFRNLDFGAVGALHCNVSSSWEARDGLVIDHGWKTLAFASWTSDSQLIRAGLCRVFCHVLRVMWKLMLQGRAIGFRFDLVASELASSAPVRRVQTVGTWSSWSRDGATACATTHVAGALSLPEAWGLLFAT